MQTYSPPQNPPMPRQFARLDRCLPPPPRPAVCAALSGAALASADDQPAFLFPWQDGVAWQTGMAGFHSANDALDFFPPDTPPGGTIHCEGDPDWASAGIDVLGPGVGTGDRGVCDGAVRTDRSRRRLAEPLLSPRGAAGGRRAAGCGRAAPRAPIDVGRLHHRPARALLGAGPER